VKEDVNCKPSVQDDGQREALKESAKKATEQQPENFKDEATDEKFVEIGASAGRFAADCTKFQQGLPEFNAGSPKTSPRRRHSPVKPKLVERVIAS